MKAAFWCLIYFELLVECHGSSLLSLVGWCLSETHAHVSETGRLRGCFVTASHTDTVIRNV